MNARLKYAEVGRCAAAPEANLKSLWRSGTTANYRMTGATAGGAGGHRNRRRGAAASTVIQRRSHLLSKSPISFQ